VRRTALAGEDLMEQRRIVTIDLAEAVDLGDAEEHYLPTRAGVFDRRLPEES
jgi:hypothetical protein